MAPLLVLLGVFAGSTLFGRLQPARALTFGRRGRLALAAMFLFTGVSHFLFTDSMISMMPLPIPAKAAVVYGTGFIEIAGAIGLLFTRHYRWVGMAFVLFLIAVFPANVYSALHSTGVGGGTSGPAYLWVRAPLQVFFIGWSWFFTRRP